MHKEVKSKYLQCTFFLDVNEKESSYVWHARWIDYKRRAEHTGLPNKVRYFGDGRIFMNLPLIFDKKFIKPNKFMRFSEGYDFRNPTPFTARLVR